jgi:hypothetical protein
MHRRPILATTFAVTALLMLGGATASQAAPGSLRILFDNNQGTSEFTGFVGALTGMPGVATLDTFESFDATPSQETLASYDLVVNTGDSSYDDPALYGDRLANYIDAGGALIQFAYDNWEDLGAHPTGRFESGGYPPFIPGNNDNDSTSLGTILVPSSPLVVGVPSFTTDDNTTDAVAPGATLLALYTDGRNAIATKGRVVSVTASLQDSAGFGPFSAAAQLVVNAGNVLGRHTVTVKKTGGGSGKVTSAPAGIKCGKACTGTFAGNTSITLKAKPKRSSFAGWKGVPGCKKKRKCTFTPTANTRVKAKFRKKKR